MWRRGERKQGFSSLEVINAPKNALKIQLKIIPFRYTNPPDYSASASCATTPDASVLFRAA
jgi:hypothetical protein